MGSGPWEHEFQWKSLSPGERRKRIKYGKMPTETNERRKLKVEWRKANKFCFQLPCWKYSLSSVWGLHEEWDASSPACMCVSALHLGCRCLSSWDHIYLITQVGFLSCPSVPGDPIQSNTAATYCVWIQSCIVFFPPGNNGYTLFVISINLKTGFSVCALGECSSFYDFTSRSKICSKISSVLQHDYRWTFLIYFEFTSILALRLEVDRLICQADISINWQILAYCCLYCSVLYVGL